MRLTIQATKEIKTISDMLHAESINIRTSGIIGESLISIPSNFQEVINLNESSIIKQGSYELRNIVKRCNERRIFMEPSLVTLRLQNNMRFFAQSCFLIFKALQQFLKSIKKKHENRNHHF